jgi:integrase
MTEVNLQQLPIWISAKEANHYFKVNDVELRAMREKKEIIWRRGSKADNSKIIYHRDSLDMALKKKAIIENKGGGSISDNLSMVKKTNDSKGGQAMLMKKSKGKHKGLFRLFCGNFSLIKSVKGEKVNYAIDYREGETRRTRSLNLIKKENFQSSDKVIHSDEEAIELARSFLALRNQQPSLPAQTDGGGDISFSQYAPIFLNHKKNDKSIRHHSAIRIAIEKLERDFFGPVALSKIDKKFILEWRDKRRAEVDDQTIGYEFCYLIQLLKVAKEDGYEVQIVNRSALGLEMPKLEDIFMTPEEEKALWAAFDSQLMRDLADFALSTAMRPVNVIGLVWSDILWREKVAHVPAEKHKNKKADGRYILSDGMLEMLERRHNENGKSDLIFVREDGRAVTEKWIQANWRKAKAEANKKLEAEGKSEIRDELNFYHLKHTCLSRAAAAGLTEFQLKAISNHADSKSLQRYVKNRAQEDVARAYLNGKVLRSE